MIHLLKTNSKFKIPTDFSGRRALYWGIQRILDAMDVNASVDRISACDELLEGAGALSSASEGMRRVQQEIIAAIRTERAGDIGHRAALIMHWEVECGLYSAKRLLEVSDMLRELALEAAALAAPPHLAVAAE
jgi:hypothetical protein